VLSKDGTLRTLTLKGNLSGYPVNQDLWPFLVNEKLPAFLAVTGYLDKARFLSHGTHAKPESLSSNVRGSRTNRFLRCYP